MSNDKKDNLLEKKKIGKKNLEKKLEKKLDIALKNRNFEIGLFWQRSNYFLVLNSAIAITFFSFLENDYNSKVIPILMAGFGLIVSILWLRVLFGGKFWQNYWEAKLKCLEKMLHNNSMDSDSVLFDNNKYTNKYTVRYFLTPDIEEGEHGWFKSTINFFVLKKPSVSDSMIYLSAGFIVLWFILFVYYTWFYTSSFFLPMGYSIISF